MCYWKKPMALNAAEAQSLINTRDRTGRLLVVAFQGSLSPEVRTGVQMLRSGQLGEILNIHAVAWQGWKNATQGAWRQDPALAGGGFMFDTGAHLLNTLSDLAGEPFVEVAAWFDFRELCEGPRSAADYIEIARCYQAVFLSGVPVMGAAADDAARRFITRRVTRSARARRCSRAAATALRR